MNSLRLYKVDIDYIKYLYSFDNRIQYNPNREDEYSAKRLFIFKIHNGKYGILGFNNMIPVKKEQLVEFDINKENEGYKHILISQYHFCNKHVVISNY